MVKFEFNIHGVCTNPHTIFRTTSKDKRYPYQEAYFSISTCIVGEMWVYGCDFNMPTYGGGYAASKHGNKGKLFYNEKDAIKTAAHEIIDGIKYHGDNSKLAVKMINMAKEIINPIPVELNLFD